MGTWTCSFRSLAVVSVLAVFFFFCAPHSYVRVCAAAAVEDHCLVLCLGIPTVWLRFLACAVPAVSWMPDSYHLAWMIDAVVCGLSSSFCASTLWVERHSVPWACLPHPALVPIGLIDVVCLGPVFLILGFPSFGWIRQCRGPVFLLPGLPWSDLPDVSVGLLVLLLMV